MPIYYFLIYAHQSFSTFHVNFLFPFYDGCTCINSIMKLDWPIKIFPFYSNSLQKFPNLFKSNSNWWGIMTQSPQLFPISSLSCQSLFDPYTIWLVLASQERIKRAYLVLLSFFVFILFLFFLIIFLFFIFNLVGPDKIGCLHPMYVQVSLLMG